MELNDKQLKKFWDRVQKTDDCWIWWGSRDEYQEYGRFRVNGKRYQARRISWIIHNNSIPLNYVVFSKCRNYNCVNPEHLELRYRSNYESPLN